MTELEKLENGLLYNILDKEVAIRKQKATQSCYEFNNIPPQNANEQSKKIKEIFGSYRENLSVQAPFFCDYGKNIHVGDSFLSNYNLTILDIAPVHIGDHVMIGPNVNIYTVNHPLSKKGRREKLGQAEPVKIGNDVWIGGNVTINPGVKIADNVIVASGAIVTKDLKSDYIYGGIPAKPIKMLPKDEEI